MLNCSALSGCCISAVHLRFICDNCLCWWHRSGFSVTSTNKAGSNNNNRYRLTNVETKLFLGLIHGEDMKNVFNPNINSGIFVIFFLLCLPNSSFLNSAVQTLVAQLLNHNRYFSFDLTFLSLPFLPQFQTIPPSLLPTSFSINTSVCCLSRSLDGPPVNTGTFVRLTCQMKLNLNAL